MAGNVHDSVGFDLEKDVSSVSAELVGIIWALVWVVGKYRPDRVPSAPIASVAICSDSEVASGLTLGLSVGKAEPQLAALARHLHDLARARVHVDIEHVHGHNK
eukprot:3102702-Pyramimonas_sp.AAC.1